MRAVWEDLANAIILRAIDDYRSVLCGLGNYHCRGNDSYDRQELEAFFRSEWCEVLTSVDPAKLMESLQSEFSQYEAKELDALA